MNKLDLAFLLIFVSITLMSCNSTNSKSKPLFKDIIQNSTWYTNVSNNQDSIYQSIHFGDTNYNTAIYNFPCGGDQLDSEDGRYLIRNNLKLITIYSKGRDTAIVLNYSKNKFNLKMDGENYIGHFV
jgi:hypothetical protein